MIRPPLLILAGAAILAVAVTFWPGEERDIAAEGLLPASAAPRLAVAAMEEASSAARMTRFAGAGAPALADAVAAEAGPPPPPPADALPVLVGVMGRDGQLTGYFSSNGMSIRARRGDSVDGWKVAALGRREARLVKGRKVLKAALFTARGGPLSPPMAAPPPRAVAAAPTGDAGTLAPAAPAGPPKPRPVRKPLPPLPKGSKGWWSGPPGEPVPPGYTQIPKLTE